MTDFPHSEDGLPARPPVASSVPALASSAPARAKLKAWVKAHDVEYQRAAGILFLEGVASTSLISREMRISYPEACILMQRLQDEGYVTKPDAWGARSLCVGGK